MDDVYTWSANGYIKPFQGCIAFFYPDPKCFAVELVVKHGPNVISCELVLGSIWQQIVGVYIRIRQALNRFSNNYNQPILMGNLNVDLTTLWVDQTTHILMLVSDAGLEDMLPHFRQQHAFSHCNTRGRYNERASSRNDYILGAF